MEESVIRVAEWSAAGIEAVGIAVIALVLAWSLVIAGIEIARRVELGEAYVRTRRRVARGILLGLEFLVAADIIQTVAVDLTFERVGVLAIVVLIRTFLSFTLELESTGRWPWQKSHQPDESHVRSP